MGAEAPARPHYYGFLSNAETAALVSPDGSVDWLPLPRFDGEAVFARLLDEGVGGACAIRPACRGGASVQSYLPGTNVLVTSWTTPHGRATVTDFLVVGRPQLRRGVEAEVPMELTCTPRFGYGLVPASFDPTPRGAVFENPVGVNALALTIRGSPDPTLADGRWILPPGRHEVVLHYFHHLGPERNLMAAVSEPPFGVALRRMVRYWRSGGGISYHGPFRDVVMRSLCVLRGLTYRTTGAFVAAATTSLPEEIGGSRQWDYRFAWVRDGAYAAEALLLAGDTVAVRRFLEFLLSRVDILGKPLPCPFLSVDGTLVLGERELRWLAGHRGSRPVRVGNAATWQDQLDIEGDLLWVVWQYYARTGDRTFLRDYWWAIQAIAEWVRSGWRRPDAGLWEFRDQPARHTHSAVLCWVALSCAAQLADAAGHRELGRAWRAEASAIAADVRAAAQERFTRRLDGGPADAALLCLPLYGFVDPAEPVWQRTLAWIEAELVDDDLVFRYRADPMGKAKHPFLLASFWLARAHHRSGNRQRAERLVVRAVEAATSLDLWSEHYDLQAREPRGNFPQLFVHAAMATTCYEIWGEGA